jgi:hypothetical protein
MTINPEIKKSNQSILSLAKKCMLINGEREKKIAAILNKRYEQEPECSIIDVLKEEKILSDAKIEFLKAFKLYQDTLVLDTEYAKLAIANNFTDRQAIDAALDFQKDYYAKTEKTKEISEILLKQNQISLADSTAILLSQNRISDEKLANALKNLGRAEDEKKLINKRFGVIALKKELITLAQLNRALLLQKRESEHGCPRRFLHEILGESADLKQEDILRVLKDQKQFETRRLNIENALFSYNSDIKLNTKFNQIFQYRISKNGLEAYVSKIKEPLEEVKLYEFIAWLKQAGIKVGIVDDDVIEDFFLNKQVEEEILIAKGYPHIDGLDEKIEILFDKDSALLGNQNPCHDKSEKKKCELVRKGDIIANIVPGKKGKPGKDVRGNCINPPDIKKCFMDCGKGVIRQGYSFIAEVDGIPSVYKEKTFLVLPLPEKSTDQTVAGNITKETGEKYSNYDLIIDGTIEKDGGLECRNIILHGDMAGKIIASGNADIKGCVGTKGKNNNNYNASIFASGNIIVNKNIFNAKLETLKELIALNAEVNSSTIVACDGIALKSVIYNKTSPSILEIGKKYSTIKIKDQLAKGTIIRGQASEMIVPETIYGVKLMEDFDPLTGEAKISVKGYYS